MCDIPIRLVQSAGRITTSRAKTFYTQTNGLVTGDNDYVSIANIALQHVLLQIETTLKTLILFKRYIDDINFLSQTKTITDNIKKKCLKI